MQFCVRSGSIRKLEVKKLLLYYSIFMRIYLFTRVSGRFATRNAQYNIFIMQIYIYIFYQLLFLFKFFYVFIAERFKYKYIFKNFRLSVINKTKKWLMAIDARFSDMRFTYSTQYNSKLQFLPVIFYYIHIVLSTSFIESHGMQ